MRAHLIALASLGVLVPSLPLPVAAQDPSGRAEAASSTEPDTLVGLPVLDASDRKVGKVANVVVREPGNELVVIDFRPRLPGTGKLVGLNINTMHVGPDGRSVVLNTLKREYLGDMAKFTYGPGMKTAVPLS